LLLIAAAPSNSPLSNLAAAQDTVYLKARDEGATIPKWSGEILDFTGKELRMRPASGKERTFPSEQIARVTTTYTDAQKHGDELFAAQDYRAALAQYRIALGTTQERRPWVRRQIVAQAIWCLRAQGQTEPAGQMFLQILLAGDPNTPFFDCIPLAWTPGQPTADVERSATIWLASTDSPAAMLLGASHLLGTPQGPAAVDRLNRLTTHQDRRIAWLAQAQLWRSTLFQASEQQLLDYLKAIDDCPESLRAGPYFLIGTALARRRPQEAALALMNLPILFPRERRLAAAALLTSGEIMQRGGRDEDAARLYRELIDGYRGSPEAATAAGRLSTGGAKP
jgi:tetratricopeptide (TPR) repeat protein